MRVASLLPAATEIVSALGLGEDLVGVSHECDFPPEVAGLAVLTRSRVAPPGAWVPSGALDREVRRVLAEAASVYEVDVEALARARPDVIVTQDLCEVCAVSLEDVRRAAREVLGPEVAIVSLRPTRLGDVLVDVRRVAEALGRAESGRRLAAELEARLRAVESLVTGAPRLPVLTLEWLDPPMVGGTWMPELVALAGGTAVGARPGEAAPVLSRAELSALEPAPEVVLAKPCGFELERTLAEEELLLDLVSAAGWPAFRTGRVYAADGNAYFNRPGPRLVESLEILAACVHPERVPELAERHAGSFRRIDPSAC